MADKKEMTTLSSSVGADAGQSSNVSNEHIITDETAKFNDEFFDYEENSANIDQIIQRMNDPGFMPVVSMEDIYGMVFSPKEWIIKGILRSGLYILAGAPKVGKSFLVGQIAYHVSTGRPLWGYPVHRSPVLYMALEDDHQRLQERMFRMFGVESTKDLYFSISAKNLREGLEEQITGFVKDHPGTRLIIIDTLKKIRPGDDDTYSYARDYADMTQLKKIADDTPSSTEERRSMRGGASSSNLSPRKTDRYTCDSCDGCITGGVETVASVATVAPLPSHPSFPR